MDDDHKEKVDDPIRSQFSTDSNWSYFFPNDSESLIGFGWNLPTTEAIGAHDLSFEEFDRIDSAELSDITRNQPAPESSAVPAVAAGDASTSNPSVSSSSSDDPPEKSTSSGGSGAKPPTEIA